MSYNYNFIEHTADIAFKIEADSLEDLFVGSSFAFREAALNLPVFDKIEVNKFFIEENTYEELLVALLDELNFLLTAKQWVFKEIKIFKFGEYFLEVELSGQTFYNIEEYVKEEIKAITYHQLEIKFDDGKYGTNVVFDI